MIHYIKQLANELSKVINKEKKHSMKLNHIDLILGLAEELKRLDPRDFNPDTRYTLVCVRQMFQRFERDIDDINKRDIDRRLLTVIMPHLMETIEGYMGLGSFAVKRSFNFVNDPDLRLIIERDYNELSLTLFPDGAWKSTVIMAGSILEAILYDALTKDPATISSAESSAKAPKHKGKVIKISKGRWALQNLIEVATAIGIIPAERAKTIDKTLRDYRNFVHPKKEIRSKHECSEAEALMAKGSLDGICNYFEKSSAP